VERSTKHLVAQELLKLHQNGFSGEFSSLSEVVSLAANDLQTKDAREVAAKVANSIRIFILRNPGLQIPAVLLEVRDVLTDLSRFNGNDATETIHWLGKSMFTNNYL
jgi:hypothetical protein